MKGVKVVFFQSDKQDIMQQYLNILHFLPAGKYQAQLIGDGKDARSFGERQFAITADDSIRLSMRPFGGAVIHFSPQPAK